METPVGTVPRIAAELSAQDRWGSVKARWGIGRMNFTVDPGLYALGNPGPSSHVFVTANYKMSFDSLRSILQGLDAWILVLDTRGINVWCAAGKGTFGTEELVRRVTSCGLDRLVTHRNLILPQLAGPGVAAHEVKKQSSFKVIYGPVRAEDLPAFMENGLKARPEMRQKKFTTRERTVLIPIELVSAMKWALIISPFFFVLGGILGPGSFTKNALYHGLPAVLMLLGGVVAGAILTPLLLPWVPGRAFSLKGLFVGAVTAGVLTLVLPGDYGTWTGFFEMAARFLFATALSAYLAMNFTGASTFTSLSGVRKEMKWAVPFELATGGIGLCLWLGTRVIA
jgi:CO dehydrogenase/acetyl-CoA synthase delta subunit